MTWSFDGRGFFGKAGLFFALATVLGSIPAQAEEQEAHKGTLQNWELYGSVRLQTAYWNRYKWYKKVNSTTSSDSNFFINHPIGSTLQDTLPITAMQMGLQNNSYFGVRGKGEKFGFGFEMGLGTFLQGVGLEGVDWDERSLSQSKRLSTFMRKIYGDWYINQYATLRIGQDWNIANFFISNQVFNSDAGLGYSGILYTGRKPQLKLSVGGKYLEAMSWKAQAAIIKQDVYNLPSSFGVSGYLGTTEEKLPKFEFGGEVGYEISKLLGVGAKAVGGIAQYDAVIYKEDDLSLTGNRRAAIKSNLLGVNLDLRVWKVKTSLTYARGQNLGSYGVWLGNPDAPITDPSMVMFYPWPEIVYDSLGVPTGDVKIYNAKTWQGGAVINVQALPWLAVEGGIGQVQTDHEDTTYIRTLDYNPATGFGNLNGFERLAYYGNLQITVADGHFQIVPEFSFSDLGGFQKSRTNEAGGKWYSYALKLELDI